MELSWLTAGLAVCAVLGAAGTALLYLALYDPQHEGTDAPSRAMRPRPEGDNT